MKSITFVRHGVSICDESQKLNAEEYRSWLKQYDEVGILPADAMPKQTVAALEQANFVIVSDLRRAKDTLAILGSRGKESGQSPLLREASIPAPVFSIPFIKARPGVWNVMMRLFWLAGYAGNDESYRQAKKRAVEVARMLSCYTDEYEHVFVVGHGFFNRMVGKQLGSEGWELKGKRSHAHWSCTVYEKE